MRFYPYAPKKSYRDLKNHRLTSTTLFRGYNTLVVITASNSHDWQTKALVSILRRFKRSTGWNITDIIGIHPSIYTHNLVGE